MSEFQFYVPVLSLVDDQYHPLEEYIHAHLNWLKSHGAQGILVMGTTGEFPNFSVTQRQQYLEAILRQNPGLKVMVNIGASSYADIRALQQHAVSQTGVDQILWMPPFYYPGTQVNGLDSLIQSILEHQPEAIPLLLYHFPKMSQVDVTPSLLEKFPRLAGLKDTSGDFTRIGSLVKQFPARQVFVGTDYQVQLSKRLGCTGIISGLANVFPQYFNQSIQGDPTGETILERLRETMTLFTKIPAMKTYLNSLGLSAQKACATYPFRNLDDTESKQLLAAIQALLEQELAHAAS